MAESDMCPTCHTSTRGENPTGDGGMRGSTYFNGTCSKECARTERLVIALNKRWAGPQRKPRQPTYSGYGGVHGQR